MGRTYADLGQKQKTFESYNQALAIWREIGNRQGEASSLNNLGQGLFRSGSESNRARLLQSGIAYLARDGKPERRGA